MRRIGSGRVSLRSDRISLGRGRSALSRRYAIRVWSASNGIVKPFVRCSLPLRCVAGITRGNRLKCVPAVAASWDHMVIGLGRPEAVDALTLDRSQHLMAISHHGSTRSGALLKAWYSCFIRCANGGTSRIGRASPLVGGTDLRAMLRGFRLALSNQTQFRAMLWRKWNTFRRHWRPPSTRLGGGRTVEASAPHFPTPIIADRVTA